MRSLDMEWSDLIISTVILVVIFFAFQYWRGTVDVGILAATAVVYIVMRLGIDTLRTRSSGS